MSPGGMSAKPSSRARRVVLRGDARGLWGLILALGGASCALLGLGLPWMFLAVLGAALVMPGRRSVLLAVPAAGAAVMLAVMLLAMAASLSGLELLRSSWGCRAVMLSTTLLLGLLAQRTTERGVVLARGYELVAAAPGLGFLGVGVVLQAQGTPALAPWYLVGYDNLVHYLLAAGVRNAGGLDYTEQGYPRAVHSLMAVIGGGEQGGETTPAVALNLLSASAGVEWMLWGLSLVGAGLLAGALTIKRAPAVAAGTAGMATGLLLASSDYTAFVLSYGFATTIGLTLVLTVMALEWVELADWAIARVVAMLAGVVLVCNTWQLLLIPALFLWGAAVVGARQWPARQPERRRDANTRTWMLLGLAHTVALGAGALPLLGLLGQIGGVERALADGQAWEQGIPELSIGAVLLGSALWVWWGRREPSWAVAVFLLLIGASAVALSLHLGVGLDLYYPKKILWAVAAVGLGPLAALLAVGFESIRKRLAPQLWSLAAVLGVSVALTSTAPGALEPVRDAATGAHLNAEPALRALSAPSAPSASVVWRLSSRNSAGHDRRAGALLEVYHLEGSGAPPPPKKVRFLWSYPRAHTPEAAALCDRILPGEIVLSGEPVSALIELGCDPERTDGLSWHTLPEPGVPD